MNQPVEEKCVCCCECCDLCVLGNWLINLCDCECNYDCNCLAKFWFCKPDVCYPLFRISIYPCMLSFCASYTAVCGSLNLVALILMISCCGGGGGGGGTSASGDPIENPCKICDECCDAWTWLPLSKICNELHFWSSTNYENAPRDEKEHYFWSTSFTCFNETFCTEPQEQKADTVTVQPQTQKASIPSSVPKIASDELPSYAQVDAFSAILNIELVPGKRESWSSVSDV